MNQCCPSGAVRIKRANVCEPIRVVAMVIVTVRTWLMLPPAPNFSSENLQTKLNLQFLVLPGLSVLHMIHCSFMSKTVWTPHMLYLTDRV